MRACVRARACVSVWLFVNLHVCACMYVRGRLCGIAQICFAGRGPPAPGRNGAARRPKSSGERRAQRARALARRRWPECGRWPRARRGRRKLEAGGRWSLAAGAAREPGSELAEQRAIEVTMQLTGQF